MSTESNYRLLRLKSGEKIIAECIEKDEHDLILHRPMEIQIFMAFDEQKNAVPAKLVLVDWLAFSEGNNVVLPKEHILASSQPNAMISALYDREKLRIDTALYNKSPDTEEHPEVDTGDDAGTEDADDRPPDEKGKGKKKKELVLIQMTRETLVKLLEQLGLDINQLEPWKESSRDDDDAEEEEECDGDNKDGSLDIMPDPDGDGFHDPWGNPHRAPDN